MQIGGDRSVCFAGVLHSDGLCFLPSSEYGWTAARFLSGQAARLMERRITRPDPFPVLRVFNYRFFI